MGHLAERETAPRKITAPHTKQGKAEKGIGKSISKICYQENMIPMSTWEQAPLTKNAKGAIQKSAEPEELQKQINQDNINTWTSPNGQTQRQIDYIMINQSYRNTVKRAWAIQSWRGIMAQQRQHATIQMDITLRLARKYHAKPPPETGKQRKYDLAKMWQEPRKLEKWPQQTEQKYTHKLNGQT